MEKIQITNRSSLTLTGPLFLMLQRMTPGRHLVNPSGNYLGNPYTRLDVSSLAPGQSVDVTLTFDPISDGSLPTFLPRLVTGSL